MIAAFSSASIVRLPGCAAQPANGPPSYSSVSLLTKARAELDQL
jgi:hypothetical protein